MELQIDKGHRELFYDISEDRAGSLMSVKMLEHNKIPGLLPVYQQHVDDKLRLSYEIGGRISLQKQYGSKEISVKRACQIIKMVIDIILAGEQFFLLPEEYCVDFSHIYLDQGRKQVFLCYLPDVAQVFPQEFRQLLEFLMEHLEHRNKQDVSFYYAFYDMYCSDELSLIELAEHIRLFEEENGSFPKKEDMVGDMRKSVFPQMVSKRKQDRVSGEKFSDDAGAERFGENIKFIFCLCQTDILPLQAKNLWTEILPKQFTCSEGKYVVGRQEGSAVHILSPLVSRCHAEIEIIEGQAYITDQGSQNGTYVNERKLSAYVKTRLQSGDKIRFADTIYRFSFSAEKSADAVSLQRRNKSLRIHDIADSLRQRFPFCP